MSIYFPCVYYERREGEIVGRCKYYSKDGVISWCTEDYDCEHQTPSRADVIRGMSDEELAKAIADKAYTGACNDFDIAYDGNTVTPSSISAFTSITMFVWQVFFGNVRSDAFSTIATNFSLTSIVMPRLS